MKWIKCKGRLPVNLDRATTFIKSDIERLFKIYFFFEQYDKLEQNDMTGIPDGLSNISWHFESQEERDKVYDKILEIAIDISNYAEIKQKMDVHLE